MVTVMITDERQRDIIGQEDERHIQYAGRSVISTV
jgi:hypothetical protein